MRYAVVIERAGGNASADVPDLPGCAAMAAAVEQEIRAAIHFPIEGLREDAEPVPHPTFLAEYVDA